jgi:tRNA threonylcarbamoyladenosine biosynthesis protein TsaB
LAYILNIETTSTVCSVALSSNDILIDYEEINNGFSHAENLHLFIQNLLEKNSIDTKNINAIAISSGPGSYTGLRIGYSAAKGLAFALNIPLIDISTLEVMAEHAFEHFPKAEYACPLIDARRMEVYTAVYHNDLSCQVKPTALILSDETLKLLKHYSNIIFLGDGLAKSKDFLSSIENTFFIDDIMPSAKYMIKQSYKKYLNQNFADIAYSEPNYLKEFYFQTSEKTS